MDKITQTPIKLELYDLAYQYPEIVDKLNKFWKDYRKMVGLEEFESWDISEKEDISD